MKIFHNGRLLLSSTFILIKCKGEEREEREKRGEREERGECWLTLVTERRRALQPERRLQASSPCSASTSSSSTAVARLVPPPRLWNRKFSDFYFYFHFTSNATSLLSSHQLTEWISELWLDVSEIFFNTNEGEWIESVYTVFSLVTLSSSSSLRYVLS